MLTWTTALPYFSPSELECNGAGIIMLDYRFAAALPELRRAWGSPLSPTSVCRTPGHNTVVGGHPRSLHLTLNPVWPTWGSMAADITWRGWPARMKLDFAHMAWSTGWSVGLHDGFCHIDRRGDMTVKALPKSCFLYGSWTGDFNPADVLAGS